MSPRILYIRGARSCLHIYTARSRLAGRTELSARGALTMNDWFCLIPAEIAAGRHGGIGGFVVAASPLGGRPSEAAWVAHFQSITS